MNKYPLDYSSLVSKMKNKYKDFVINQKFYSLKREFELNKKYCGERYLDRIKKTGTSKKYYSTEIFKEFDKHYKK
jgi:hypothetical protein